MEKRAAVMRGRPAAAAGADVAFCGRAHCVARRHGADGPAGGLPRGQGALRRGRGWARGARRRGRSRFQGAAQGDAALVVGALP
eukprot:4569954-Prymnesium_polylepis.1